MVRSGRPHAAESAATQLAVQGCRARGSPCRQLGLQPCRRSYSHSPPCMLCIRSACPQQLSGTSRGEHLRACKATLCCAAGVPCVQAAPLEGPACAHERGHRGCHRLQGVCVAVALCSWAAHHQQVVCSCLLCSPVKHSYGNDLLQDQARISAARSSQNLCCAAARRADWGFSCAGQQHNTSKGVQRADHGPGQGPEQLPLRRPDCAGCQVAGGHQAPPGAAVSVPPAQGSCCPVKVRCRRLWQPSLHVKLLRPLCVHIGRPGSEREPCC